MLPVLYLRSAIILLVRGSVLSLQETASSDFQAGRKFEAESPPYVEDPYSAARFEAGLPIPVTCCWNGILSIDAAPLAKGVRFRYARCLRMYRSQYKAQLAFVIISCSDQLHSLTEHNGAKGAGTQYSFFSR